MELKIGDLAEATGTSAPTVRYYEQIGLLPAARRRGAQRRYGEDDVRRLTFVRRCRDFGFPIEQVRLLLTLTQDGEQSCMRARDIAASHLAAIREKIKELQALEAGIAGVIESADEVCEGASGPDCVVLGQLGEPKG